MVLKILITGGSGFLGSRLAQYFKLIGHEVHLLLRPTSNLDRLGVKYDRRHVTTFTDTSDISRCVTNFAPDIIFHVACAYGRNGEDHEEIEFANVTFGMIMLQAIARAKLKCTFVNCGTVLSEKVNAYAFTKRQFVHRAKQFVKMDDNDTQFINMCLQHFYGANDNPTKFPTWVIHSCLKNKTAINLTLGTQVRDFVHIEDVISACNIIANKRTILKKIIDIDVGSGTAISIKNFVGLISLLTGSTTKLNFGAVPQRDCDTIPHIADISMLLELGWLPKYDIITGLKQTIEKEAQFCGY